MTTSRHGRSLARWSIPLILAALGACGGEDPRGVTDRPNLVLMVSDDQGLVLGCYGHPDVQTPRLDALAAKLIEQEKVNGEELMKMIISF